SGQPSSHALPSQFPPPDTSQQLAKSNHHNNPSQQPSMPRQQAQQQPQQDIVSDDGAYDWLDFPFWPEAVSHAHKFHTFVAWLADTDAYLCAVVINRKAE